MRGHDDHSHAERTLQDRDHGRRTRNERGALHAAPKRQDSASDPRQAVLAVAPALLVLACGGPQSNPLPAPQTTSSASVATSAPELAPAEQPPLLAAGGSHVCLLRNGVVLCWGANAAQQTGVRGPDQLIPVEVPFARGASAIAAGAAHTCALGRDGTASCWGEVDARDGLETRTLPGAAQLQAPVVGTKRKVLSIAAGGSSACAIEADRSAICWSFGKAATAVEFPFHDVVQVVAGWSHQCVLRHDGSVW